MRISEKLPLEVSQAVCRLGDSVRLARVRRRLSQAELAETAHITRKTLYSIEKGVPSISIGNIYSVLWSLGLLDTSTALADPDRDDHGKILEAARQPKRVRQASAIDNDF